MDPTELLVLNGVDVATGTYLTPPLRVADVARAVRAGPGPGAAAARDLDRRARADEAHLGVAYGFDPDDLASVGWGVVVPEGYDDALLEALGPLLELRRAQAGDRFRRLELRAGEDKDAFLARHGAGPSVVDPRKVPYYLLLLGSPEQLPFDVQHQLGVSHAVGRLDLADPAATAAYAASVIAAEGAPPPAGPPGLHVFATRHPGDTPTALSASRLAQPLAADLRDATASWAVTEDVGGGATRARLEELLTGPQGPALLFTAGHGIASRAAAGGDGAAEAVTGALLCQDWPGPLRGSGAVAESHYLAAAHLAAGTRVTPRVVVSFACFGAGTPDDDAVPGAPSDGAAPRRSHTARLPRALLGREHGALAFVGHVDRAWSCSFLWKGMAAQITPFASLMLALMDGARVGWATEALSARYAEVTTELARRIEAARSFGRRGDDAELVGLWTASRDARGYVVLGDPAVRAVARGSARLGRR